MNPHRMLVLATLFVSANCTSLMDNKRTLRSGLLESKENTNRAAVGWGGRRRRRNAVRNVVTNAVTHAVNSFTALLPCTNGANGQPCENQGTVTGNTGSCRCLCVSGYDGDNCENNIDNCASNPCQNGGTCTNTVDSFTCECATGVSGATCEVDADECDAEYMSAVVFKGFCNNQVYLGRGTAATCWELAKGDNRCNDLFIVNSGRCYCTNVPGTEVPGTHEQGCNLRNQAVYVNDAEDSTIYEIAGTANPCHNRGVCTESSVDASIAHGHFSCTCADGWTGDTCADGYRSCDDAAPPNLSLVSQGMQWRCPSMSITHASSLEQCWERVKQQAHCGDLFFYSEIRGSGHCSCSSWQDGMDHLESCSVDSVDGDVIYQKANTDPCRNGGACAESSIPDGPITCTCADGWSGAACDVP